MSSIFWLLFQLAELGCAILKAIWRAQPQPREY